MRKKKYANKEWQQRTFRVRYEAIELYNYLRYFYEKNGLEKYSLFDDMVKLAYNKEIKDIRFEEIKTPRSVKGFTITSDSYIKFKRLLKKNRNKKGETVERIIANFAKFNLTHQEFINHNKFIK